MNQSFTNDLKKQAITLNQELQGNLGDTVLDLEKFKRLKLHQTLGGIFDNRNTEFAGFIKPALEFYPKKFQEYDKELKNFLSLALRLSLSIEKGLQQMKWKIAFKESDVEKDLFLAMWKVSEITHTKLDKSLSLENSFKQFLKTLENIAETHESRRGEALGYCVELEDALVEIFAVLHQLSFHIKKSLNLASLEKQLDKLLANFRDKPDYLSLVICLVSGYVASSSDEVSLKNQYIDQNKNFFFMHNGMMLKVYEVLDNLQSFLDCMANQEVIKKIHETYEIKRIGTTIVLNNRYRLAKTDLNSNNDRFFDWVFSKPNQEISKEDLMEKAKVRGKSSIHERINDLGFKKRKVLKKMFWSASAHAVIFRNPTNTADLKPSDLEKLNEELADIPELGNNEK